jgi:hypothetical protein
MEQGKRVKKYRVVVEKGKTQIDMAGRRRERSDGD